MNVSEWQCNATVLRGGPSSERWKRIMRGAFRKIERDSRAKEMTYIKYIIFMYYFLGIEGQTVPQISVPPCVCRNLLRILLANLYSSLTTSHTTLQRENENPGRVACSFANRSACGCTSPQPGVSTPSTHHGWGGLRLVWKNSCGEKRKLRRRAASIVLHFVYERGMMDWRVNTVNPFPAEYADPFVTSFMG